MDGSEGSAEASGDGSETTASILVGHSDLLFELVRQWNTGWTPNPTPLNASVQHPRFYAFGDEGSFKFRHRSNHLEHEPPSWGRQIEIISKTDESDSTRLQLGQTVDKMPKGTPPPVQFPYEDNIALPPVHISE